MAASHPFGELDRLVAVVRASTLAERPAQRGGGGGVLFGMHDPVHGTSFVNRSGQKIDAVVEQLRRTYPGRLAQKYPTDQGTEFLACADRILTKNSGPCESLPFLMEVRGEPIQQPWPADLVCQIQRQCPPEAQCERPDCHIGVGRACLPHLGYE